MTEIERDTILAALRLWQQAINPPTFLHAISPHPLVKILPTDELFEIATNGDAHEPMTSEAIDDLCERLNTELGLRLFYVNHNEDGINFDLFIRADTPEEAAQMWRDFFADAHPRHRNPHRIYDVPAAGKPGALRWRLGDGTVEIVWEG